MGRRKTDKELFEDAWDVWWSDYQDGLDDPYTDDQQIEHMLKEAFRAGWELNESESD